MQSGLTSVGAIAGLLAIALQISLAAAFPKATGYVNDFAAVLDADARTELESLLRDTEQKTTAEVVVATVSSLDGMTVEDYANRLFREWGIGQKGKDNGVLVLVAPNDREMRIEVGYGLESILTDGLAGEIIRTDFLPRFRGDDYRTGIVDGVRHVVAIVVRNQTLTPEERRRLQEQNEREASGAPPLFVMILFFGLFVGAGSFAVGLGVRTRSVFPLIWGGLFGSGPFVMALGASGIGSVAILAPLAIGMAAFGYRLGAKPSWAQSIRGSKGADSSGWVMGSSSSKRGSGSGGSSGGGFGGGRSGGGGASGRW